VGGCAAITLGFPAKEMVLVLPSALILAAVIVVLPVSIWQARRAERGKAGRALPPEPFALHPNTCIVFVLLGAAGVIDMAFAWPAPIALTLVFAFASLWVALRDWPIRKHYLVGAVLPLALLPLLVTLPAARSFTLFLFAVASALAIESYLDGRNADAV
jgi:hypothetical protein